MQPNKKTIYIIIPVYNEAKALPGVIRGLLEQSFTNIVIVDDGSFQDIRKVISDFDVIYLRHKINLGQGASLQTGFDYLKEKKLDAVVTFDGDGQHDPRDINGMLHYIFEDTADIVLGSRFLTTNKDIPFLRRIVLQIARLINFLFSGLLLSDAHNGLRALNKKALTSIRFSENRMAHASEILFRIKENKLKIKEAPVTVHYTRDTKKNGQSSLESVRILFDLVLHKLFK